MRLQPCWLNEVRKGNMVLSMFVSDDSPSIHVFDTYEWELISGGCVNQ